MPLRVRLALFGAGVVALTLALFGALLYSLLARGVGTNQDDALKTRAVQVAAALGASPDMTPRVTLAPADLKTSTDVFVEVITTDGSIVYTTGDLSGAPPAPPESLLIQAAQHRGAFVTSGSLRLYAQTVPAGYVLTGQSTRVPQSSLSGIVVFLIISAIPALLAALAASWLVAGRALRPLKSVAGEAEEIGRTRDFGRRLPSPRSRDEVAQLSASFNRMLVQLQDSYESQRRFVADASHELRTPLTTIQGNAGLLSRGPAISEDVQRAAADDIAEESGRMARLLDRMLTLARADSGLQLGLTPVGLEMVVTEVCRQAVVVHPQPLLNVAVEAATVEGDEDALRQLIWILLDNAFRYAHNSIEVRLSTESDWARLVVSDDGPGIPIEDRTRVFERFYRADAARTGGHAGLGLSIARWVADQHRGRILAVESPSAGCSILVDIPLLRSS